MISYTQKLVLSILKIMVPPTITCLFSFLFNIWQIIIKSYLYRRERMICLQFILLHSRIFDSNSSSTISTLINYIYKGSQIAYFINVAQLMQITLSHTFSLHSDGRIYEVYKYLLFQLKVNNYIRDIFNSKNTNIANIHIYSPNCI